MLLIYFEVLHVRFLGIFCTDHTNSALRSKHMSHSAAQVGIEIVRRVLVVVLIVSRIDFGNVPP